MKKWLKLLFPLSLSGILLVEKSSFSQTETQQPDPLQKQSPSAADSAPIKEAIRQTMREQTPEVKFCYEAFILMKAS